MTRKMTLKDAQNLAIKSLLNAEERRDKERELLASAYDEDVVAKEEHTDYNKVKLQLRFSARVILDGPVSGKRYEWAKSGAVVEVDEVDVAGLLTRKIGDKPCCGGSPDSNKLFEIIE